MSSPRKNIILDLDESIINSVPTENFPFKIQGTKEKAIKFRLHDMDGYYMVFERPGLQEFLDYVFDTFDVSIWTAASKDYALFIIDKVILKMPARQLKYIMFAYHCDLSKKMYDNNIKDLRLLYDVFKLDNMSKDNVLIVDDLDDVYNIQPEQCLQVKTFEFLSENSEEDNELLTTIKSKLQTFNTDNY